MAENNNHPRKISIVIIAILILIQGILYLAASAWSFLIYKCRFIPNTQLGKVMQFIYFRDYTCGEISWSKSSSLSTSDIFIDIITQSPVTFEVTRNYVVPDMPNVTFVAFRTYILVIAYGIISGLWVLTALMVLGGLSCSSAGRKTFHFCFTPWIIVVTLGCILDAIATGFHIHDIYHTSTAEDTLRHLEVRNIREMMNEIKNFSKLFSYPAIILTCVSCRLILFWLINLFGVYLASRKARKIMCHKLNKRNSSYEQQVIPSQKDVSYDREFSSKEPSTITYSTSFPDSNNRKERKTFEPFKPTSSGALYDNKHHYHPDDEFSESRYRSGVSGKQKSNNDFSRYDDMSPIAYRKFQQHYLEPDHRLSLNTDRHTNRELPPNPPVGYRFSMQNPTRNNKIDTKKHSGIDNVHITDELRGQLPWSYFSARDDLTTAKRALSHAEEHEIMPPVPVPDYTYHFPRKERPSIKSGDNDFNYNHHLVSLPTKSNHNNSHSPNTRW